MRIFKKAQGVRIALYQRLRSRGGKGVICPPWNFQTHVILPNFAQKRHKLGHFHEIFSTLPPLSLRPYASAVRALYGENKTNLLIETASLVKVANIDVLFVKVSV